MRPAVRDERGIALAVALAILLISLLLAAAAVAVATQTNDGSNRDTSYKAALAAADAGLRAATYRLSMLRPDATHCVWTPSGGAPSVASPGTNGQAAGYCQDMAPETLGNGSTFQYWMTPEVSGSCTGYTVVDATQRCITSVGVANGVRVRTQARVAAFAARPFFPVPGLLGRDGILINNNAIVNGEAGSNGTISLDHSSLIATSNGTAALLGPAGNVTLTNGSTIVGQQGRQQSPFPPGDFSDNSSNVNNDDARITRGQQANPTPPYDPSNGITWNASKRTLSTGNNGSFVTLGGSIYNFCDFTTGNKSKVTVNPGTDANGNLVTTMIYIDSPTRMVDGQPACPSGTTGTLTIGNGTTFVNTSNNPALVVFLVFGNSPVTWNNNNATNYLSIVAPNSQVLVQNNGTFQGAINAKSISITNNATFTWDSRTQDLQDRPEGIFFRSAWKQCPATPSGSDPASGC